MSEEKIYNVPAEVAKRAWVDDSQIQGNVPALDQGSGWLLGRTGQGLRHVVQSRGPRSRTGTTTPRICTSAGSRARSSTPAYNCLDRHLEKRGDQTAIIWEGDDPKVDKKITYRELHAEVCKFANVLKGRGVKKGDRVCIYMPMIPEAAVAMLACARIGAVHSVVFGGFSPESLKDRILDSDCRVVITADEGVRGGKKVPLKANTDQALTHCPNVHTVLVVKHTGGSVAWNATRDVWYHEQMAQGLRRLSAGGNGCRGPAVHSLYLRLHRQAQGRAAHHRRLSVVRRDHPQVRLRLSRRRYLLVHRRRRLGDGPLLYRLRPAGQRRDHAHVRGRAELSDRLALLGGHRQAPGEYLLHRADGDPRAHARGRGAGQEDLAKIAASCSAPSASRSTPRPGSGITTWSATRACRSSIPGGRPRPAAF